MPWPNDSLSVTAVFVEPSLRKRGTDVRLKPGRPGNLIDRSEFHVAHADAISLKYASRVRQACAFNKAKVGVR